MNLSARGNIALGIHSEEFSAACGIQVDAERAEAVLAAQPFSVLVGPSWSASAQALPTAAQGTVAA